MILLHGKFFIYFIKSIEIILIICFKKFNPDSNINLYDDETLNVK